MNDVLDTARLLLGPLFLAFLLTDLLIRTAPALRLVDVPDERKNHPRPTPKVGGLAIYTAVVALTGSQIALYGLPPTISLYLLLGGGLIVVVLGLADDLYNLSWKLRLLVQVAVAVVTLALWPNPMPLPLRLVGVVWVVGMINAFNMLDNMDALSPGTALLAATGVATVFLLRLGAWGVWHPAFVYLLLAWALVGFLWFNRPPARAFLGDAGSTFLGFVLGVGSLDALAVADGVLPWFAPIALLGVPCYDMTSVVLLRLRQGRSPFHADRQHLSHRLVRLGLQPARAVAVIHLLALACGAAGVVLYLTHELGAALLVMVQLTSGVAALVVLEVGVWARTTPPPPP